MILLIQLNIYYCLVNALQTLQYFVQYCKSNS